MITYQIESDNETFQIAYNMEKLLASIKGRSYPFEWDELGGGEFHLKSGTCSYHVLLIEHQPNGQLLFQVNGRLHRITVRDERQQLLNKMDFGKSEEEGVIRLDAPMPGKVLQILVKDGTQVRKSDPVVILEAMKMENEIRASCNGRIDKVHCRQGSSVEKHQLLMTILKNNS